MLRVLMLCSGLLGALPADEAPSISAADRKAYEAARAEAGRDVKANVRLALWCEERGLDAERLRHLAIAVMTDPSNAAARGLMGLVHYQGKWSRPEDIATKVEADAALSSALAEYNRRRAKLDQKSEDDHWKLALWCEKNNLDAEARAHLTAVVRLNPGREAAWKRMGFVRHNGHWTTPETIEADKAERTAQRQANALWGPRLKTWKSWLRTAGRRDEAERLLAGVDDRRATSAVMRTFATSGPEDQKMAVQLLGQIDSVPASQALALLAVVGATDDVRRAATETLRGRDVRAYAGGLIGLIRDTLAYQVRPVNGPGQPGALLVRGEQFNRGRIYAPPALPNFRLYAGEPIYYDNFGLPMVERTTGMTTLSRSDGSFQVTGQQYIDGTAPLLPADAQALSTLSHGRDTDANVMMASLWKRHVVPTVYPMQGSDFDVDIQRTIIDSHTIETYVPIGRMIVEARKSAAVMQQQLKNDVQQIEFYNKAVSEDNARVVTVLNQVSGQELGPDRDAWKSWWTDQLGYSYVPPRPYPRPTVVEMVPPAYVPQPVQPVTTLGPVAASETVYSPHAQLTPSGIDRYAAMGIYRCCFGAGTSVMTLTGSTPIEAVRVGDRVLARDQKTGELTYRPVLTVFHYPPTGTLRLVLDGESIVTSPLHRFWRVGDGWIKARDLKPGDAIRTLGGRAHVLAIEPDTKQPVFNLNVADDSTFLVGRQGILVHDNTLPGLHAGRFDDPSDQTEVTVSGTVSKK